MDTYSHILNRKHKWERSERQRTARALRSVHKALIQHDDISDFRLSGKAVLIILALTVLFIGGCFIGTRHANADQISETDAIRALIGEASNQGEIGMTCVAEVIRKRGSLKGIYGFQASHINHEPQWVWKMARRAWLASAHTQYTKGADHFENIRAFGCPSWVRKCVETFRYKDHVFYKEV